MLSFRTKFKKLKKLVEESTLFNNTYYLKYNHDARIASETPIDHFIKYGLPQDRKPNKDFDPIWYREYYKDIQKEEVYPLVHFILFGKDEQRSMNEEEKDLKLQALPTYVHFDTKYYLKNNIYIEELGVNPFEHYISEGWKIGRNPNNWFDPLFYLQRYPDVKDAKIEPLHHYITKGKSEGREACDTSKIKELETLKVALAESKKALEESKKLLENHKNKENTLLSLKKTNSQLLNFKNFYLIQEKYFSARLHLTFEEFDVYSKNKSTENLSSLEGSINRLNTYFNKINIMNTAYLYSFDEARYLSQNDDVRKVVSENKIHSGLEHLFSFGLDEIKEGKRKLYKEQSYFNEPAYLKERDDVKRAIDNKKIHSALQHFIIYNTDENTDTASSKAKKTVAKGNYRAGGRETKNHQKTIILCAHIVGNTFFGSERSLLDMLEGASVSYNVILLAPRMNNEYFEYLSEFITKFYIVPYGWWKHDALINQDIVQDIKNIIVSNTVNMVHVNTIMLREALIAGEEMGIPTVTHIRELITGDKGLCEYIGLPLEEIKNDVLERSNYIIANSNATLNAYNIKENTHNYLLYNTLNSKLYTKKPLDEKCITIGIISSNIPKKGIFDFVEVAKLCEAQTNLSFKIIGPETEHTDKIKALGLGNLEVSGYRKTPQEAMKEIDIVLSLSNFTESFGRTVAEGMASYKAVVAYRWGAVPELMVHEKTGFLVDYLDVKAVSKHLIDFALTPSSIISMGLEGRKRVEEKFDISIYKSKLTSIYQSIFEEEKSNKINIGYFLWHFPVPSETFVLNELRKLVQLNYDVKVYCKQSPFKDFQPDFPITWERVTSIDHFSELLIKDKRACVHSHFTYPTVTDMVWPACEKAKIPFTFIAHAQDIFRYSNEKKNRIDEISKSEFCYKVFVPARFHFNYLVERGVSADKMVINPNTVDPDLYIEGLSSDHSKRETKSICAIHRFTEKKGLENLIKSAKFLESDMSINIYGYGDLEESYKQIIKEENLSNVHLKGGIKNREAMLKAFSENDLFACPSVRAKDGDMDGIPTVLMEAMASGIPVLTTNISGIPDLVSDSLTGMITESTAENIAKDVKRFYAFPSTKVKAISENARALIETKFNTRYAVDNLLRVWEQKTIDLIIVSWNNLPELQEVVRRLLKFTTLPFRLIICDNLSKKNVRDFLREIDKHEDVSVIFNDSNAMVGPGTNKALELGISDYAIYVCGKEGFTFDYGWEIPLVKYMEAHQRVGQAGTLGYSPTYLYGKDYPTGVAMFDKFRNKDFAKDNPTRMFKHAQGGFFIMRRKMYEEIGGFSYDVPHNYTDVEYSYYVESCGWELGEIPEMLALFNKTKPGLFSRMDETMYAMHPPMMDDLPRIDDIVQKRVKLCHLCEWSGEAFDKSVEGLHICPQCGSEESERSLFKYIAQTAFTHRRIPAFGVGLKPVISKFWEKQFQGRRIDYTSLSQELKAHKTIQNADAKTYLLYINSFSSIMPDEQKIIIKEFYRLLHLEGEFILQLNDEVEDIDTVIEMIVSHGFVYKSAERYCSEVCQYDWNKLIIFKKGKI
jgi:glycosyltransferase involved in cell wall biosynthesis